MVNMEILKTALDNSGADMDMQQLELDTLLTEVGLDSLDIFNLFVELEQHTGHQVPDLMVDDLTTPAAIIDYFSSI